jgi:hypothetical protein
MALDMCLKAECRLSWACPKQVRPAKDRWSAMPRLSMNVSRIGLLRGPRDLKLAFWPSAPLQGKTKFPDIKLGLCPTPPPPQKVRTHTPIAGNRYQTTASNSAGCVSARGLVDTDRFPGPLGSGDYPYPPARAEDNSAEPVAAVA